MDGAAEDMVDRSSTLENAAGREHQMSYSEYVSGVSFRFIQPHTPVPSGFRGSGVFARMFERCNVVLDLLNTRLPDDEQQTKTRLGEMCKIPRMSTFAIAALVNRGVSRMPDGQAFVNVGVWNGFTFLSGMVSNPLKTCIGVDNFSESAGPRGAFYGRFKRYRSQNHRFYEMDCMDYFSRIHSEPIGFYIYDGNHSYENQVKGLEMAEQFLAEDCLVLVDDTNWAEPWQATMDFIAKRPNQYRILLDQKTRSNRHPTFWNGVMVFQKVK